MTYKLSQQEIDICDTFNEVYAPYEIFHMDLKEMPDLPLKGLRTCRFCGKSNGQATFKNNPHRFSKFLCNPYGIWEEECDDCNLFFNKYETNLSHWFGLHRLFSDIRPGNKRFIFSAVDGSMQARRLGQMIFFEKTGPDGFEGNAETGELTINTTPLPYTPAFVYNAFLKSALSALPKEDMGMYKPAVDYIQNYDSVRNVTDFRYLGIVETNLSIEHSSAILYKRKIAEPTFPLHMFCFYVRNFMFQIALTLDVASHGRSTSWTFIAAHYLAKTAESDEPFVFSRSMADLNSPEQVQPEKQSIILAPDKEALKNLACVQLPPDFLENLKKWNGRTS